VVKATGDETCALFTSGQSAVDGGFHLPYSADDVAKQLNEAEEELYSDEEGEDTKGRD
jgi:hypothetical protein